MRRLAIWTNISALRQLVAELAAALAGGRQRSREALGELFLLEDAERGFGGPALRGHPRAQLGRRLAALRRELRGAKYRMRCELQRVALANAGVLGELRQLLDQPEDIRWPAAGNRSDRVEQPLVLEPHHFAYGAKDALRALALGGRHLRQRVEAGDARADQRRRIGHAAHQLPMTAKPERQRRQSQA